MWLNIGDSYAGSGKGRNSDGTPCKGNSVSRNNNDKFGGKLFKAKCEEYKRKDLMGIPWRIAFALQADGWYLRQDIIWYKPNCMPESVKDRCTRSHEYIFLFSKSSRYYFDYESIKEPAVGFDNIAPAGNRRTKGNTKTFRGGGIYTNHQAFNNSAVAKRESKGNEKNETGLRNRRDVWQISTKGYREAHFATFPEKLVEPCILAGSPKNEIILDPFGGSGTVGAVAKKYNRNSILIDINEEYCKLSAARIKEQATHEENQSMHGMQ